ncbi:MAG TPA: hypothetical protein VKU61_03000 [Candidatus Binatia bacterium]|nr:hypothetical protein [Candidatus Binatia bacterium]
MRKTPSRLVVAILVIVTTAFGSWLLLADAAGLGANQGGRSGKLRTRNLARPASHGYGGYSGICINGSLRALSAPESFIHRGRLRCFASTGNPSGDNADLSTDVFVVDNQGNVSNMTKDTRRCVEGSNNGNSCTTFSDCPQGSCEDTNVLACTADARGHFVFFIFDGNPTGKNPDLSDELFSFDTRTHQLTQLTSQRGWCNNNPAQGCDSSSDCSSSSCARARMTGTQNFGRYGGGSSATSGLEVSPDGGIVWFITDGDPGGNPSHAVTQFALALTGSQKGLRVVASAGKFCGTRSKHPGTACASTDDCRPICGDGIVDPGEQCEPFHLPPCPSGTFCRSPGFPDGCTCVLPVCGNGVLEPGEVCDGFSGGCFPPRHCNANCSQCSPSGAFLDVTP